MNDEPQERVEHRPRGPKIRLEATVHPGEKRLALEGVADLDLDRIPDPEGGVRLLITADEAAQLVERGYEVRLLRALPVRPLDPALVMDDDGARAWLEDRLGDVERREGS
jgi:hypothetical protein